MEPTTPCATKTFEEEKSVKKQVISGRRIFIGHGSSGNSGIGISSTSIIQVSMPCKGVCKTNFTMEGQYPTIRLP